ncbi:outer membrane protein assembly factor BamA [Kiloniella laminariae]|uniref:Outer membrane protein assembly factor BamA n=1 Tax=Kiloniella laminariae TaxID=454162 RepID=A0ABT4LMA3_9PROT|nr:outer membrane protein assembly factor BamA [Kiloniella laminariae]MCZ4282030.1 outer membrane protein assembly factor BamA [Kiloniella laminariae]
MLRKALFSLLVGGLLLALEPVSIQKHVLAQALMSGGTIDNIVVEGTQRIEPESVRSYMSVNPGDTFDPVLLNRSLKSIFATGLFADVSLKRQGNDLIVVIVENPIINRIAFEGNLRIKDEILQAESSLRERVVFTRTKAQADAQRLLELYRRSGRFAATVEPKVIQLPQNRVDLVFEISEGDRSYVTTVNFIGNREFSDGALQDVVSTTETVFWNFLTDSDTYDPDRLTFDRELLRRFYLKEGYADFEVQSVIAELTPNREAFVVTFTVSEGARYKFGTIDVESALKDFDPATVQDQILTEENEWYDASLVDKTVDNLTDAVGNLGYAFVDIKPSPDKDSENKIIHLVYNISEGPKVYVERIDIEGNSRTIDKVIRREFRLVEGDAFNSSKLRRSRSRIQRLGFFKSVNVDNEPGSTPDRTVIKVDVEEQSTGELTFGAGFSSSSGPLGSIGIRERNLLGRGQDLRFNIALAGSGSEADVSFTEPYFLDKEIAAGFDIFRTTRDEDSLSFEEKKTGGALRVGFDLSEELRQVLRYRFEYIEIENVDSDAAALVKEQEGETIKSSISSTLTYDKLDSRTLPTEGYILKLENEVAGLGGDVKHLKVSVGGTHYYTFEENWTLRSRAEVGNIIGLGEDTRIVDRFFLGGDKLRGFKTGGVGPRDRKSDDALGGKHFYSGGLELSFPLGLPKEFAVKGRVFTDFGATWNIDGNDSGVDDESTPRVSIGAGLTWSSPFGPLATDLGFATLKEDFDETEIFSFSFGTQF